METHREFNSNEHNLQDVVANALHPLRVFFNITDELDGSSGEDTEMPELGKRLYSLALAELDKAVAVMEKSFGGPIIIETERSGESIWELVNPVRAYVAGKPSITGKRADPEGEIPDFRTVQHDTTEEDQLQRVFEVMRQGGKHWERLQDSIDTIFEQSVREHYKKKEEANV